MKKEIKDEWVRRLESGKFQQGTGQLRNQRDGYCCLGVLCEIAVEQGVIERWQAEPVTGAPQMWYYGKPGSEEQGDFSATCLPKPVLDWMEQDGSNGSVSVDVDGSRRDVISLNDTDRWTFDQIAAAVSATENFSAASMVVMGG